METTTDNKCIAFTKYEQNTGTILKKKSTNLHIDEVIEGINVLLY